ncbi:RNA-binding protein Nova-1 isoform X4 [Octopus sinensis]|uniref:RNA-binding protein Nova-1 isoform X4 n=1 Tax=Octopus sinensis TaxID=2607531 RepID=A0A6P7TGX8_9MOLL|nr:RNA-binding protein Nova-1 isoform X4 [Octopus sinensis]
MAMSFDGMNGSDMDTSDSRKRPSDAESDSGVTKRSNQGGGTIGTPDDYSCEYKSDSGIESQVWAPSYAYEDCQPGDEPLRHNMMASLQIWHKNQGENVHLKILVPSAAAGAIIGKGGETIAQVQKDAGARVKMSKANDHYPGTSERVCLITGSVEAVRKVHTFIMEKIREKPEPNPKLDENKSTYERHRQVKILVPNSTAGMIIGKGGIYIKQIKEESGAYVQISQKSKETNLPERCVTVAGDVESNRRAVDMILQKIVEDPQSGSCPNISYADYTGPVASANPTGSPFANTDYIQNRSTEIGLANNNFGAFGFGFNGNAFGNNIGASMTNLNLNAALSGGTSNSINSTALDNIKITLRGNGFSDQATEEISTAMNTLASYGILASMGLGMGSLNNLANLGTGSGLGTGLNLNSSGLQGSSMMSSSTTSTTSVSSPFFNTTTSTNSAGSLFGPVGSGSSGLGSSGSTGANSSLFSNSSPSIGNERYGGSPMLNDSFGNAANYPSNPGFTGTPSIAGDRSPNVNQNSFGLGTGIYSPADDKSAPATKQEMEVPETIVGAILGPGGKGIVEIQQFTGTNIQISKKGVYVPGTRNRVVTITGTPNNISKAQLFIQRRLQQEEMKRARQASTR